MLKQSLIAVFIILLVFGLAKAQVPNQINYQGRLTDAGGNPVSGTVSIQFKIYDAATVGTMLWNETQSVTVTDGIFNVLLGSVTPIPYTVFDGAIRYLGITVGADPEMTPRKALVSVGYAYRAYDADKLDGQDASAFLNTSNDFGRSGVAPDLYEGASKLTDKYVNEGQANAISTGMIQNNAVTTVKITPDFVSSVDGVKNDGGNIDFVEGSNMTITSDDANNKITFSSSGGGDNLGNHTATQNIKLSGHWLSGDGGNEGVYVHNDGRVGIGTASPVNRLTIHQDAGGNPVIRLSSDAFSGGGGSHIRMLNSNGALAFGAGADRLTILRSGNVGIGTTAPEHKLTISDDQPYVQFVETDSYNKKWHIGMYNQDLVFSDDGGYRKVTIQQDGNVGIGTTSPNAKLEVIASGGSAVGVSGRNSTYGSYGHLGDSYRGVYGYGIGVSGIGVYGYCSSGRGVYGSTYDGWAGYFYGNVKVTGSINPAFGATQMDHPFDPTNKYLNHSFVVSPDMKNVYDGVITLDANGEAEVELPEWFETINKDFRYQLTCIGGFAQVYIAEKIRDNRFKIAGGKPAMEVSWQVTGIRDDAFAKAHRVQVETEKTGQERGKYLHPEENGVSETLGIDYEENIRMEEELKRIEQEEKRIEEEHQRMMEENKRMEERH